MSKYKIGDIVEVVESFNEYIIPVGSIAEVIDVSGNLVSLVSDDFLTNEVTTLYWLHSESLKLVECQVVYFKEIFDKIKSGKINVDYTQMNKKKTYNPLDVQQSGDHYSKKGIQPIEYGMANNLSFPQANIVKYITRHGDKNGIDDLAKSIHYHFFEALRVYGEEGSTELRDKVLKLLNAEYE